MELFVCIKMDLALNTLQWLICLKTKPKKKKIKYIYVNRIREGQMVHVLHQMAGYEIDRMF